MNNACGIDEVSAIFGYMSAYDAVSALEEFGISVRNADGSFRYLTEILNDVSKAYKHTFGLSRSNMLSEASQSIVRSFRDNELQSDNDTALDEFLSQFTIGGQMI